MAWTPNAKEIASVIALSGETRYQYGVKKIADQETLWSLREVDGWAVFSDDLGRTLIPVWPHESFAALCATGPWSGYKAESITLDAWLDRWLPGMERDNRLVAVFPTPDNKGVVVEPRRFEMALREELLQYD